MRIVVEWEDSTIEPKVELEGNWHPRQLGKVHFFIVKAYRQKMRTIILESKTPKEEVKRDGRRRRAEG